MSQIYIQIGAYMSTAPTVLIYIAGLLTIAVYIQSIGLSKIIIISDSASIDQLFISSLPLPFHTINSRGAPKRLKNIEKLAFSIPSDLKEVLVGLILGDLHGRLRHGTATFVFKQGLIHQDYIYHLYEL